MTRHAASLRHKETRIPFREAGLGWAAGFEAAAGRGAAESTPGRIQNRYGVFKSECNGILLKERGSDASRFGGKLRDVVARNAVVAHLQVGYAAGDLKVMVKSYYMHYIASGKKDGRAGTGCKTLQGAVTVYNRVDYSAVFDYNYYITNNGDIKAAFWDDDVAVLAHFVNYGMSEGRRKNC